MNISFGKPDIAYGVMLTNESILMAKITHSE
jgi:hypothetical protein